MAKWLSQTTQARVSTTVSTVSVSGAVCQAACSESPRPHVDATTSPSLRDRCVMLCSRAATLVLERRVEEAAAGTFISSLNILLIINATERALESLSPREAKSGQKKKKMGTRLKYGCGRELHGACAAFHEQALARSLGREDN